MGGRGEGGRGLFSLKQEVLIMGIKAPYVPMIPRAGPKRFAPFSFAFHGWPRARFRVNLDPKEPIFLGFLILISLHKSLKGRLFGVKEGFREFGEFGVKGSGSSGFRA